MLSILFTKPRLGIGVSFATRLRRAALRICSAILLSSLAVPAIARAEGGCPPGQYPQSGQGWQTCVPIPGGENGSGRAAIAPIPSTWASRWGSLATGGTDHFGISAEMGDEASAIAAAIDDCKARGGVNCRMSHVYANQCMAVIGRPDRNAQTSDGSNEKAAVNAGMTKCSNEGIDGCWVYYSGCSLPIEVPK